MTSQTQEEKHLKLGKEYTYGYKFNAAFKEFKRAVTIKPDYTEAYSEFGSSLTKARRYAEAVEQYSKMFETAPFVDFDISYLCIALDSFNMQEAIGWLQNIVDRHDDAMLFIKWGQVLTNLRRYHAAVEQFKKGIIKNPDIWFYCEEFKKAFEKIQPFDEALESFSRAIDSQKNANAFNIWGKTLNDLERYQEAIQQFQKATSINKKLAEAYFNWGDAEFKLGNYNEAVKIFQQALENDKKNIEYNLRLGESLIKAGQYQQAIEIYQQATKLVPSIKYLELWLCAIRRLKDRDVAIDQFQEVLNESYDTSASHILWGNFLVDFGRYDEGITQYVIALAKDSTEFIFLEEDPLEKLKINDETLQKVQQIIDDRHDTDVYITWARELIKQGYMENALVQLQKGIENITEDSGQWFYFSDAIENMGKVINLQNIIISLQSKITELRNANAYWQWGHVLYELDEFGMAIINYQKAIELDKGLYSHADWVSDILTIVKDQTELIRKFQEVIDDIRDADTYNVWGQCLTILKKNNLAIQQYQKAIKLKDDFAEVYNNLGKSYINLGQYDNATEQFKKATERKKDYADAYLNWGKALVKSGKIPDGIQKFCSSITNGTTEFKEFSQVLNKQYWNEETIRQLQAAVDNINEAHIYDEWGLTLTEIGKSDLAIRQFQNGIEIDPDIPELYANWRTALIRGEMSQEAITNYEEIIKKYLNNDQAYYEWGNVLYNMYKFVPATENYKKALEKNTKCVAASYMLSACLLNMNYIDQAIAQVQYTLRVRDNIYQSSLYFYISESHHIWGLALNKRCQWEEAIKQFELGIKESPNFKLNYFSLGYSLLKLGRNDEAIYRLEQAVDIKPQNYEAYFEYGILLGNLKRYNDATIQYMRAIELGDTEPYPRHNIASILQSQGQYEVAWQKWKEAVEIYEKLKPATERVSMKIWVDSNEFYYHASVVSEIFGDIERAEAILKKGLAFEEENTSILAGLFDIYLRKKEQYLGIDPLSAGHRTVAYTEAMVCFKKAERVLKERLKREEDYTTLEKLGYLYLAIENYKEAEKYLQKAKEKDDKIAGIHSQLGRIYLHQKDFKKAIESFQDALKYDEDNLEIRSHLAEALFKADRLDEAERIYKAILGITSYHVQSLIGLGEVCTAMAEKGDMDCYQEAESCFSQALKVSRNEKNHSKDLKKSELAAVYYSRGYARSKLFECSRISGNYHLLKEALDDFRNCRKIDPNHQKAIRAIKKIEERIGTFSPTKWADRIGPVSIFIFSFIIFCGVQIAFFVIPLFNTPNIMISEQSLAALADNVSVDILNRLGTLKGQEFDTKEAFLVAIQPIINDSESTLSESLILENADEVKPLPDFPVISLGFYVLLTFGSLLFMITGLYLPQVLKLRVGGIELEKSAVDQVRPPSSLGINK